MAVTLTDARNPAAADGLLAWDGPGGVVVAREHPDRAPEPLHVLPGTAPALGGGLLAWIADGVVRVVRSTDLAPVADFPVDGATAVGVTDGRVAVRWTGAAGDAIDLIELSTGARSALGAARGGQRLGRPVFSGGAVVYHVAGRRESVLAEADVAAGARVQLRRSTTAQLTNPAQDGDALLFVRQTSLLQQLVLALPGRRSRVLFTLRGTSVRDHGFERGHSRRTRTPRARPPAREYLWTTALSPLSAYVTVAPVVPGAGPPRVVQIPRPR